MIWAFAPEVLPESLAGEPGFGLSTHKRDIQKKNTLRDQKQTNFERDKERLTNAFLLFRNSSQDSFDSVSRIFAGRAGWGHIHRVGIK